MDSALGFDARRLPVSGAGSPFVVLLLATLMAFVPTGSGALVQNSEITPAVHPEAAADELAEIMVETREPRFVAPTLRDQIGRIWAPVFINGRGPFRLVLDTGASNSAVNSRVAEELGLPLLTDHPIMLRGVTGTRQVPTIPVKSLVVGDLELQSRRLPIVTDALGGA